MNWQTIVKKITSSGKTQQEIADFCGCSQSTVGMLASGARGKSLSYEIGNKILELAELSGVELGGTHE